jgi:transcriptional regulator with XRE-family HTH domain/tetratricopeptide (TPR) repeat protein
MSTKRTALIAARMKRHWTLEQAAEAIGVNHNTLWRWEQEKATPRGYNLQRLCEVYETTATALGLEDERSVEFDSDAVVYDNFVTSDLTTRLLALAFVVHQDFLILQDTLAVIIEEHITMYPEDHVTRRNALRRLATLPLLTLKFNADSPIPRHVSEAEAVMTQCSAAVTACWELSKSVDESDLSLAFRRVSVYLPTLKAVVRDSAPHRQAAASLVGQCELLRTVLGWHLQGLKEAAVYAKEAVLYAREANDIPLLLSVLDYKAWLHYYDRQDKLGLNTVAQGLLALKEYKAPLPPRLLSGIYSTLAVMRARNGEQGIPALRKAAEAFFADQEEEHRFVYVDYTKGELILNDGMVHYQQGAYDKALDSFSQLIDPNTLALKVALPERTRIEGLNVMTLASLKSPERDMERTLHFWTTAIEGARALQSEQRYNEALAAYDVMEAVWPNEKRVRALRDFTLHW